MFLRRRQAGVASFFLQEVVVKVWYQQNNRTGAESCLGCWKKQAVNKTWFEWKKETGVKRIKRPLARSIEHRTCCYPKFPIFRCLEKQEGVNSGVLKKQRAGSSCQKLDFLEKTRWCRSHKKPVLVSRCILLQTILQFRESCFSKSRKAQFENRLHTAQLHLSSFPKFVEKNAVISKDGVCETK